MLYDLIRPLLFCFEPEIAHKLALTALRYGNVLGLPALMFPPYKAEVQCFGIDFPNRVGLAAGFDKNGAYLDALSSLGFGFIEIGTVTPRPQTGNPKPRMFRLAEHRAIINRMGFNNHGLAALALNVGKEKGRKILGISIGKNAATPESETIADYLTCLEGVYPLADYVAVNISSPNTVGLRKLQDSDALLRLLDLLKEKQSALQQLHKKYVPLLVKIAPDLTDEEIATIGNILIQKNIDGVIATNTTVSRKNVEGHPHSHQAGGLSGAPLTLRSLEVVRKLAGGLQGKVPIIGSGGVMTPLDAAALIEAGASLVQLYTGLIYQGPALIANAALAAENAARLRG